MNARVRQRTPSTITTRKRTIDRAACNQETKGLRELKHLLPMNEKLPTHMGIKRYFTPETMAFLRNSVRQGIGTERDNMRLPQIPAGALAYPIGLARDIHLDVLKSSRIDPRYAQGLIDGARMVKMGAEENGQNASQPMPIIATVKKLGFGEKGEVKMTLESEEIVAERTRFAEFLGSKGVKAFTYVEEEDPLEVIIARNNGVDLTATEGRNLLDGIHAAMSRLQSESPAPGIVLELKPWEYTKNMNDAICRK